MTPNPLRSLFVSGLAIGLMAIPCPVRAADEVHPGMGLWITPFGGYRLSGAVNLDDPNFSKIDLADNPVYGLGLGWEVQDGLIEFMWTHQDTEAHAIPLMGGPPAEHFNLNTDQFHFNGLYFPPSFDGSKARPYAMAGLGMTSYNPTRGDVAALNRFSWALGGGLHIAMTQRLGLRFEGKWDPSLVSSSSSAFCSSTTGRCFVAASGDLIEQFDFTAGLTVRL